MTSDWNQNHHVKATQSWQQKQLKLGKPGSIGSSIPKLKWTNGTWWVTPGVCCWTFFSRFLFGGIEGGGSGGFCGFWVCCSFFFSHWKAFSLTAGKNNKNSGWFDATWGNKILYYLPLYWLENEAPSTMSYWNAIIYYIKEIWGSTIPSSLYKKTTHQVFKFVALHSWKLNSNQTNSSTPKGSHQQRWCFSLHLQILPIGCHTARNILGFGSFNHLWQRISAMLTPGEPLITKSSNFTKNHPSHLPLGNLRAHWMVAC